MRKKIMCCCLLPIILLALFCGCVNDDANTDKPQQDNVKIYSYQAENPTPIDFEEFVFLSEEKGNMPILEDVLSIDEKAVILGDIIPDDELNVPYAISKNRNWLGYDGVVSYSGDQVSGIIFTIPNVTYRDFALIVEQLEELSKSSFEFKDWSDGTSREANIKISEWKNENEVIRDEKLSISSNFVYNEIVPGHTGEFRISLKGKNQIGDHSLNLFEWHQTETIYNELTIAYGYPVL